VEDLPPPTIFAGPREPNRGPYSSHQNWKRRSK